MDTYIPALLCCLHYRFETEPLQPFATTLYLHTRRWEWIIYPSELALITDLYNLLRRLPIRLRNFFSFKLQPQNEEDSSHDILITALIRSLAQLVDKPRPEPEWPDFLLTSQYPLREFPCVLNRGQSSQSLRQAVYTLMAFLELVLTLSYMRIPLPAMQKFTDTCLKLARDICVMLSFYQRFAHETFFYLMLRQHSSRQTIESEQLHYAIRRLQDDIRHFANSLNNP